MGLRSLDASDWIEVDDRRDRDLAEKRRLLATCPDQVLAVTEDADGMVRSSCQELLDALVSHLAARRPALDLTVPAGLHPIDAAGRLTQEDWCVHLPDAEGAWCLVAASVCFPTRWDLTTKIGRTIRQIHAPVPLYEQQLADPMDAYFARMRPGPGVWRLNWNLLTDPTLHQPTHARRAAQPDASSLGAQVWLRVERQTLVKLPESGAIVFGIRIHQDPLTSIAGDAGAVARLRGALEQLPPEVLRDKGLVELAPAILTWLDAPPAGEGAGSGEPRPQNNVRSASRAPRSTS